METFYMFEQITTNSLDLSTKAQCKRNLRRKACKPSHDNNFLMGEFQGTFAIYYQPPCQWSSEISFLQL